MLGGMSQGGFCHCARRFLAPERVGALVLIDTQPVEDPERLPAYRQMQEMWLEVETVDELAETIANLIVGDPVDRPGSRNGADCRARPCAHRATV